MALTRKRSRSLRAWSALAAVLILAGCTVPGGEGPLDYGGAGNWTVCTSGGEQTHLLFASHIPVRDGGPLVTIDSVAPMGAKNLEVLSHSLMFLTGDLEMSVEAIPPGELFQDDWRNRVAAEGATFGPGDHVQLVSEVRVVGGESAFLQALRVVYTTAQGGRHSLITNGSLKVSADGC